MTERTDRTGQQIGDYRLVCKVGSGSFGTVYLGAHVHEGTQVAVKILQAKLTQSSDLKAFINEARVFRLKHPHILPLLDFGVDEDDVPFLVMAYALGGTLRDRHPKGSRLPLAAIVSYVNPLASALSYAHSLRLIHRDVKPENMLLGPNGELWLSDFGIMAVAQSTHSSVVSQGVGGTLPYMAPEQIQGHPRPASDQYALGILVYEWLCGRCPFQGTAVEIAVQHAMTPPPPPRDFLPSLDRKVEQVVLTALAKDPKERFATIEAFATALRYASQQVEPVSLEPNVSTVPLPPLYNVPIPPAVRESHEIVRKEGAPVARIATQSVQKPIPVTQIPNDPDVVPFGTSTPFSASVGNYPPSSARPMSMPFESQHQRISRPITILLISLALLLTLLVGAGGYYIFLRPVTVQAQLNQVNTFIAQAKDNEVANPGYALQSLATAQTGLRNVKSSSLNQQQTSQFEALQSSVEAEFKVALSNYNKNVLVTTLPCQGTSPTQIQLGTNNTSPSTLASVKDEKDDVFSYVHMADSSLYQIDNQQHTLINKYPDQVSLLTNDTQNVFILTTPSGQTTPSYDLHILRPDTNGVLGESGNPAKTTIPPDLIKQGLKPQLMTAWDGDIYIVLTSTQSTQSNSNQAIILDYKRDKLGDVPQKATILISTGLVGIAAFPNRQLFLLHDDGTVKSLQSWSATPTETDVDSLQTIATPWGLDAQHFTIATPIVAPPALAKNKVLSIPVPSITTPPQSLMVAGLVDTVAHLYITDNTNHRILDFTQVTGGAVSVLNEAGVANMRLVQQYVSPVVLPAVRSLVVDPGATQLDLMTAEGNSFASVNIGVAQKNACSSPS